ncbi:UNVERIFIED_CONTAM: SDR family oxidoreductase [Mycobacterium avium subsp. hominissuis]
MIIKGKVFVVTGAGSGIGRDVVFALTDKGARVAAVDNNATALQETAALGRNHSDRISTHILDVTDRMAVSSLPDSVAQEHGVVDGLVNVAGVIHRFARVNDLEFTEIERIMDINFYGILNMTKAFLPVLLKRPEAHITAVSSMGSFVPVPGQTIYGASKAAVKLLMEGLNSELRDTNVGVSVVFPGAIATSIAVNSGAMTAAENAATAATMRMTPSPVAAAKIVRGIEKCSYHVFIGADSVLLDKLSRLMPARSAKIVYSQMRDLLAGQPDHD